MCLNALADKCMPSTMLKHILFERWMWEVVRKRWQRWRGINGEERQEKAVFLYRWIWQSIFLIKQLTVNEMHQNVTLTSKERWAMKEEKKEWKKESHFSTISLVFMLAWLGSCYSVRWAHSAWHSLSISRSFYSFFHVF